MSRTTEDADRIVSLCAILVSVGTLLVIVYQAKLSRETARAAVLPYLTVALMANDKGVSLLLENVGVGPALIDDVRVRYQGREIEGDPYDFYVSLHRGSPFNLGLSVDKVRRGRLIPAGQNIQMLAAAPMPSRSMDQLLKEFLGLFDLAEVPESWYVNAGAAGKEKAVVAITYSSVYGSRWIIRSDQTVPDPLNDRP